MEKNEKNYFSVFHNWTLWDQAFYMNEGGGMKSQDMRIESTFS